MSFSSHGYGIKTKHSKCTLPSFSRFSSHGYGIKTKLLPLDSKLNSCFSSHGLTEILQNKKINAKYIDPYKIMDFNEEF